LLINELNELDLTLNLLICEWNDDKKLLEYLEIHYDKMFEHYLTIYSDR
jgi:hypothetical protein